MSIKQYVAGVAAAALGAAFLTIAGTPDDRLAPVADMPSDLPRS
jgi:hypothetical protein